MIIGKIVSKFKRRSKNRQLNKRGIVIAQNVDYVNVDFEDYVNLAHHAQVSNSTLGKRTSVGRYSKIQFADIGKYCSISWDVTIGALEHPLHSLSSHAFPYRKQFGICREDTQIPHRRVTIGNDVWIGCGAIIMPGIAIGNGAIIGAGSVVTHDVKPYEIVAGCPAKHISSRFSAEITDKLEELEWWLFSDDELKEYSAYFSPDVDLMKDAGPLEQIIKLHSGRKNKS